MIPAMTQPGLELLVRVGLASLLGVAIGIERQWRARMAGLQTMALVSMGAALFVILGAFAFKVEQDPTRVAAQVVTGIGFLGAGVIMKQGSSVTGLNTAATLWATAAVGSLAGAWMWREAVVGAVIIIASNTFLLPLATRMDRVRSRAGRENPPTEYVIEVECATDGQARVKTLLLDALETTDMHLTSLRSLGTTKPGEMGLRAELFAAERHDELLESAVRTLSLDPDIRSVRWMISNEAGVDMGRP